MRTISELEEQLTRPTQRLVEDIKKIDGDIMILGVGGKMGPSLAKLAKRAIDAAGITKRIIGVSRFSNREHQKDLEDAGVETIAADLMNEQDLEKLPLCQNVIYMAGTKFGTHGNEHYTWAMNTYLPGRVAEKYRNSNIVVFSTGNVYPLTPVNKGGSLETEKPNPVGEYAQSCLGRERIFEHFSTKYRTPLCIYRLNYAIDMRYGVLLEIAKQVYAKQPVDVRMGHVNVIWQGDANEYAIRSLLHCSAPTTVFNITGPETASVKFIAQEFGRLFKTDVAFVHDEQDTALLSNAAKSFEAFGYPSVSLRKMMTWMAEWVEQDQPTIQKPTHFQQREGVF